MSIALLGHLFLLLGHPLPNLQPSSTYCLPAYPPRSTAHFLRSQLLTDLLLTISAESGMDIDADPSPCLPGFKFLNFGRSRASEGVKPGSNVEW